MQIMVALFVQDNGDLGRFFAEINQSVVYFIHMHC
jgi:hypothetical protein